MGIGVNDVDIVKLRAWWAHRQGLDGRLWGQAADRVLAETGWARSVGGSGPYLGLAARAGLAREAIDDAVRRLEIHELPSARGCMYVLPSADFALGLTVGAGAPAGEIAAAVKHLDVTYDEIDRLSSAVVAALEDSAEPLDPGGIKAAVGDATRSLGAAGKKRGMSSTLPLALGSLQAAGEIRRVPISGRLDQQRFRYVRWDSSPLAAGAPDPETAAVELARRYFSWASPASLKHFRWFSGFTAAKAKAAVEPLGLATLAGTDLLIAPEWEDEFRSFLVDPDPSYSLVAGIDGIHLLHRELPRLLDDAGLSWPVPAGKPGRTLRDEADPPANVILDRGRIVGIWEYDPDAGAIVYQTFAPADDALRAAVSATEEFAHDQLGDVRGFSLDSVASRRPRLTALAH